MRTDPSIVPGAPEDFYLVINRYGRHGVLFAVMTRCARLAVTVCRWRPSAGWHPSVTDRAAGTVRDVGGCRDRATAPIHALRYDRRDAC